MPSGPGVPLREARDTGKPLPRLDQRPERCMISTSEQSPSQAQNGSAANERRLFQFLDAVPVGVFIGLPGGRPYYANGEAIRLLGRGVHPSAVTSDLPTVYQAHFPATTDPPPPSPIPTSPPHPP